MRNILASAIALAATTHENQIDKGGKAYILHPLRMMMRLRTDDEELMAIAVLHDTVEDSDLTCFELTKLGYPNRVVAGVDALSRKNGETYDQFIKRCSHNPDAKLVKREDLRDNSDITRLKGLRQKDFERLEKYSRAFIYLSD
jgi:(p)ppGpp synthase/HD superfamily hydrolase